MSKKYNNQCDIKEYNVSIHSDSRNIVIEKSEYVFNINAVVMS